MYRRESQGEQAWANCPSSPPRIASARELTELAATVGYPVYWVGPVPGKELELKELSGGSGGVQVVYLAEGAKAGEGSVKSLTIGSYPLPDPTAALDGFTKRPKAVVFHASDGRKVVTSKKTPTSVYFASPDNKVQVEVYDPSPKRAMNLARSGRICPVSPG